MSKGGIRLTLGFAAALAAGSAAHGQQGAAPPAPAPAGGQAPAQPAPAATAQPAPAAGSPDTAEQVLLDQASYWSARERPDLASQALDRLLKSVPNQPEALLQYGLLEVKRGNVDAARQYLGRLRQVAPNDQARIARLNDALRVSTVSNSELEEARRLARAGQFDQAAQRYRQAFGGDRPVENYSLEYYQTLAGSESRYGEARAGLERLAAQGDPKARLALAQVLSYRDETRREGIDRLQALADDAAVGAEARRSWRQALVWLKASRADTGRFDTYINRFPGDAELEERRRTLTPTATGGVGRTGPATTAAARPPGPPPGPDPATKARIDAFASLNRGELSGAEAGFQRALSLRPGDSDSLGGLGVVRLRQNRFAEARDLLGRAQRSGGGGKWNDAYRSAYFFAGLESARAAQQGRRPAEAERIARDLIGKGGKDDYIARNLLADALQEQGRSQEAEREYRLVLQSQPSDAGATVGLFNALVAQGRREEALTLAERMERTARRQVGNIGPVEAQVLRAKAKQLDEIGEDDQAYSAYEEAIAADPADPWLRLDFARFLESKGDRRAAKSLITTMIDSRDATPAQLQAGAIFYQEIGDFATALTVIDYVPRAQMTPEMRELREAVLFESEVKRAKAIAEAGGIQEATRIMEDLARQPPQTIEKTGIIAQGLADIGQYRRALQMVRSRVLRAGRDVKPRTQIQYVSVLMRSGNETEAAAFMRQLEKDPKLTRIERRDLEELKKGLAIVQADRARESGAYSDGYDILYPYLAENPNDPTLLMALARLYASAGRPQEAQSIYQAVLEEDPRNIDAVRGAVGAAIEAKDWNRAKRLVEGGLVYHPREPRLYYLLGEVAKAQGDGSTARKALETAKEMRRDELETTAVAADRSFSAMPPNPFRSIGQPAGRLPGVRARVRPGDPLPDPQDVNPFSDSSRSRLPLNALPEEERFTPRTVPRYDNRSRGTTGAADDAGLRRRELGALPGELPGGAPSRTAVRTPAPVVETARAPSRTPDFRAAEPGAPIAPVVETARVPSAAAARAAAIPAPELARAEPREATAADRQPRDGMLEVASIEPTFVANAGRGVQLAQSYGGSGSSRDYGRDTYGSTWAPRDYGYSYVPPFINPATRPRREPDNLTRDIDRSLSELDRNTATNIEGGIAFRGRSGDSGLARLNEVKAPIKLNWSPDDFGTVTIAATPTYLSAGNVGSSESNLRRFGTNALAESSVTCPVPSPLCTPTGTTNGPVDPGSQTASGVGVALALAVGDVKADIGATPLGFEETNLVGGVSYNPTFDNVGLKVTAERRAKTDSVLSYAGTKDPLSGMSWGGVVKSGGRGEINFDDGMFGAYVNGGYYNLDGNNVKDNSNLELGFGTYYRVMKNPDEELTIGVNLTYISYDDNLRHFTLGHGGYFSPQSYYSASIPIEYTRKSGRTTYVLGGAVGVQNWNENRAPYFPNDPGRQAALEAAVATDTTGQLQAFYEGQDKTNLGLNVHGQVEYELSKSMALGASASFDSAADYYEATAMVYLRHFFGQK